MLPSKMNVPVVGDLHVGVTQQLRDDLHHHLKRTGCWRRSAEVSVANGFKGGLAASYIVNRRIVGPCRPGGMPLRCCQVRGWGIIIVQLLVFSERPAIERASLLSGTTLELCTRPPGLIALVSQDNGQTAAPCTGPAADPTARVVRVSAIKAGKQSTASYFIPRATSNCVMPRFSGSCKIRRYEHHYFL